MHIWVEKRYFILNSLIWMSFLMICVIFGNLFYPNMKSVILAYIIANLVLGIISSEVAFSLPVLVIRLTGFIRYLLISIVINADNINVIFSNQWIMIIEIIGQYISIILFDIHRKSKILFNRIGKNATKKKLENNNSDINNRWGIILICVLIISSLYVISHREILMSYLTFSSNKIEINYSNGLIALLVKAFFLIIYIKCIVFIESLNYIGDILKISMIIFLSIFFVNGSAISSSDVSRWTIVIMAYIAYVYICKYHAKYEKQLLFVLIIGLAIAIVGSTIIKFGNLGGNSAYETSEGTIEELISYDTLNAYFSGPSNIEAGMKVNNYVTTNEISRFQLFVSDVFRNFPLLNTYLSSSEVSSISIFNQIYYGSSIAVDQIIPFACQSYTFFSILFFIPEMILIWIAQKSYFKIKVETNFMKIYYYSYIAFFFALVNCINITIILQTIWIYILPIYLINLFNERVKV